MKSIASSKLEVKNELREITFAIIDTCEIYVYSASNVFYTVSYHGVSYQVPSYRENLMATVRNVEAHAHRGRKRRKRSIDIHRTSEDGESFPEFPAECSFVESCFPISCIVNKSRLLRINDYHAGKSPATAQRCL